MMTEEESFRLAPLTLAYIGDAVWELEVRTSLVVTGERLPNRLHTRAVAMVRAKAQADRLYAVIERLTDRERDVVRKGRNAKSGSIPKNAKMSDYRASTGLEALFGYLFMSQQEARLKEVVGWLLDLSQQA